MPSPIPFSAQIPLTVLAPLGTEAQAQAVTSAGSLGHTLLALEHAYGDVTFENHFEAKTRLDEFSGLFRNFVSESSVAFLGTFVLGSFFEKNRLFAHDKEVPLSLTNLLLGYRDLGRPANEATSLMGLAAHLGSLAGISFLLRRNESGEMSLYDADKGMILDFPSGKAEMQVAPAGETGEPLIALVAFHLAGLADVTSDMGQATRMYHAARLIYPG